MYGERLTISLIRSEGNIISCRLDECINAASARPQNWLRDRELNLDSWAMLEWYI